MTTLTDRYVYAAVRTAPEKQRPELERELRALVADATEAHESSGATDAETAALVELGDPERLAASYTGRMLQLIGPRYYLDWWRLLKLLYALVLPIVVGAVLLAQFIADPTDVGGAFGTTVAVALNCVVHFGFWTTLLFATLERYHDAKEPLSEWTPARLPEVPDRGRGSIADLIAAAVFWLFLVGAVIWQQVAPIVPDGDGGRVPVFAEELWSFWIPALVVLAAAEVAFAAVVYLRGWNGILAGVNVVLNLAFALPALWLLATGQVFADAFLAAIDVDPETTAWWSVTMAVASAAIIAVAIWDIVDGFIKAYRARPAS